MPTCVANHSGHDYCHLDPVNKPVTPQELEMSIATTLLIRGMGCPTCAMRVRNALLGIDGVLAVDVVLERGLAVVHYNPDLVMPETLPESLSSINDGRYVYSARMLQSL